MEKPSLQQVAETLQAQLDQTRTHMDQITAGLLDPEERQSVPEEVEGDKLRYQRCHSVFNTSAILTAQCLDWKIV